MAERSEDTARRLDNAERTLDVLTAAVEEMERLVFQALTRRQEFYRGVIDLSL